MSLRPPPLGLALHWALGTNVHCLDRILPCVRVGRGGEPDFPHLPHLNVWQITRHSDSKQWEPDLGATEREPVSV